MDETLYNWDGDNITESQLRELAEFENMTLEDYIAERNIQKVDDVGYGYTDFGFDPLRGGPKEDMFSDLREQEEAEVAKQEDMMNLFEDLENPFADEDKIVSRFEEKFGDEFEVTNPTSIGYNQVKLKSKSTGREHNVYDVFANFGTGGASYDELMQFVGNNSSKGADRELINVYQKAGVKADNEGQFDMYKEVPLVSESGGTVSTDTEEVLMTDDEIIKVSKDAQNEIVNNIISKGYKFLPDLYSEEEKDEAGLTDNELEKLNDDVYNNLRAKGYRISRDSYDEMLESSKFKNLVNDRLQKRRDDIVKKNSRDAYGGLDQATSVDIEQDFNEQSKSYIQANPKDGQEILELNKQLAEAASVIIQYGNSSELTTEQQQQLSKARTDYNNTSERLKELKSDLNVNDAWVDEAMLSDSEKEEVKKAQENAIKTAKAQQAIERKSGSTNNASVKQLYKNSVFEMKGLGHMGDELFVDVNTAGGGNLNRIIYNILKARGEDVTIDQSAQQKRNQQLTMMQQVDPQGAGNIGMIFQGLTGRGSTYLLDRNGKRINNVKISFNELLGTSTNYRDFQGFADESMNYLSENDRTAFKDWNLEINKNRAERKGYWEVAYAGTTPERIGNPIRDIDSIDDVPGYLYDAGGDLWTQAVRAAGSSWFDMGPEEVYKYGETKRDKLTHLQNTVNLINSSEDVISGKVAEIKFDDKDKKALEMGYTESTTTAVGGFLPTLAEFAMFELATGGAASPAALANLGRAIKAGKEVNKITKLIAGTKTGRFVAGALREEIKMQANTADFGLGTGTFFFGFGKALSAIKLLENPTLASLTNRYFTKGASGAMSIEADQIVHGIVDDYLLNSKDFNDTMSELYGDEDEVFKRVVANTLMFQLTGVNVKENIITDVFTRKGRSQFAFSKNAKLRVLQKLRDKAGVDSNGYFKYKNGKIDASTGTIKEIFDKLTDAEKSEIESVKDEVVDGELLPKKLGQMYKMMEIISNKPELTKLHNKIVSNASLQHTLEQRLLVENEANSLDPFVRDAKGKIKIDSEGNKIVNEQFERDLRSKAKSYFDAVRILGVFKEGVNKFENPDIHLLKSKQEIEMYLNPGETAKWVPEKNTIYLDLNKYTPGKAMHEFTHVMLDAYFANNPVAKENFINKMEAFARDTAGMTFSHSLHGEKTGKELMNFIKENYKGRESQGEEYFTYMMELAADPMVAATNPYLAGSLTSKVLENVRGIQSVFTKNRQTGLKNKSEVLKTIYNLSKSIYKGKLDAKTEKRLRKLALGNTKVNDNISSVLEIQEGIGDKKQSDLVSQYASEIAATKKPPKTKGKGKASKDIDRIFLDVGDPFGNRTNEEVVGVNEKINESIKKGAREAGVTPFEYKQRNPEYVGALYANNLKLVSEMMKKYQEKFEFNSSVDKEAFRAAISKSLEDYAIRYGNTKFLKERQGETKEQFEARKKGVENLDSYFYNYAKKGIQQQLKGNIQVQAGMSYREGNKIIPLTKVTGEAKERLFEGLETTESASQTRKREFNEGLTDMTGNVKLDPIKTIPSRVESNISETVANRVKDIDFKTADLTTANMPDLTNAANEIFGVKQSKITDKDGALKPNTTRLSGGELSSFQKTVFGEKGIGVKNFYTVWHNGYLKEGARAGESTMIQPVLLKEFYKDATIKRPNGDTWAAKEKLPFSEVEAKLKEFFGLKQDGTFETIKENTKLDARAKAGIFQYLKSISRAETSKWLNKNKPEGYENFALNIQGGKASKDPFADKSGSRVIDGVYIPKMTIDKTKFFEKIKKIISPDQARILAEKLKENRFTDFDLSKFLLEPEFANLGVLELKLLHETYADLVKDQSNIKENLEIQEKLQQEINNEEIAKIEKELGIDYKEAKEIEEKQSTRFKEFGENLNKKGANIPTWTFQKTWQKELLSDGKIELFEATVKNVIKDLDLDLIEKENPTLLRYIANSMNGNGTLKYYGNSNFKDGSTVSKENLIGSSRGSTAEFLRKMANDPNAGKAVDKQVTIDLLNKAKDAYQTSWGENKRKSADISDKIDFNENPGEWLVDQQTEYVDKNTLKKYGNTKDAIDNTYKSNLAVYNWFLSTMVKNLSMSEAFILNRIQTNASGGILRGLVNVHTVGSKPDPVGTFFERGKDVRYHNEHAEEAINISKKILTIMADKSLSTVQKLANVLVYTKKLQQHVIPKSLQKSKDSRTYGGNAYSISKDPKTNTFVDAGSNVKQIYIFGPNAGKSHFEVLKKTSGKDILLSVLEKISNPSSEVVEAKRELEYESEIKEVEANNNKEASIYDVYVDKASKDPFGEALDKMTIRDKANVFSNKKGNPIKKIRVFDFDDTLATSKNIVIARKDGKEVKLNAEQFAKEGLQMKEKGWEMDFSDFNKVTEGGRGPLFDVAKKIKEARGNEDLFVLTARAPEAAPAIFEFLKAEGLEFKRENIIGLGNSTGEAKASWLIGKVSEGYNDFYFADDAPQNVKAVKENMSKLDVKSKVQLVKASKDFSFKTSEVKENLKWRIEKSPYGDGMVANFKIKDKNYLVTLYPIDAKGDYRYQFELETKTGSTQKITGTGNARSVFSTVYKGLIDAIKSNPKIKRVEFSADKSEPSRVKLYTSVMDRFSKDLGWNNDIWETTDWDGGGSFDFELTKPRKKQSPLVEKVLENYDVKSDKQKAKASLNLDTVFNKILEDKSGIEYFKEFSEAKAKALGARKNKFQFYVPYSAEDFEGLLYATLAKGKRGEMQMDFYRENLLNPYSRAMNNLAKDRIQLMSDFKALKKQLDVPKDLKKVNESGFTNEQAVRVYLFTKSGHEMKDLSKRDLKELLDIVESDGKLKAFADKILEITKGDGYAKPKEGWLAGTITTDLVELLNTTKRSKYLQQWRNSVDEMFSKKNLNKLEAIFGSKYREALESSIARMKSGRNRLETGNRLSNQMLDYINGSNAAIMFFNTRSAVLQTISAANFINWTFNNPLMAGKAFANQKQYWKDFMELMNSDYLVDRRNGQKINISEAEITNAAATAKNKAKAVMAYILQKGYLPTQFADSFAIASGGATYFRNRINNLKKQGVSEAEARNIAYTEFKELSEKSQQSSDPSKISQQQSSDYGRLILMFANTPMQYTRLQKRAIQDLINGRGSVKANASKIMYYGFIQNLMFNALQQAVFAIGFGDDKMDENDEKKINRTVNGMLDSTLRGMGVGGATISVLKNFLLDVYERSGRKRPEYVDAVWKLTQISPPIGSKISRIKSALYAFDNKKMREQIQTEGISLDNPALMASAQVISATTNVPLDRVLQKIENLRGVVSDDAELWQRIAMLAGWPSWTFEDKKETKSKSKSKKKTKVFI